jgi:hypothetical protein
VRESTVAPAVQPMSWRGIRDTLAPAGDWLRGLKRFFAGIFAASQDLDIPSLFAKRDLANY